jgi:tripartite-type tricarboxylate transporter receptor subunit TctC
VANLLPRDLAADGPWKPAQGIRIVVPAAPGGTTDIVARLLAAFPVIGSNEVVKTSLDGYTALMGNIGPQSIACSLYRNMPYGPKRLAPVNCVITAPKLLVVHPSVPAKTIPEFDKEGLQLDVN